MATQQIKLFRPLAGASRKDSLYKSIIKKQFGEANIVMVLRNTYCNREIIWRVRKIWNFSRRNFIINSESECNTGRPKSIWLHPFLVMKQTKRPYRYQIAKKKR